MKASTNHRLKKPERREAWESSSSSACEMTEVKSHEHKDQLVQQQNEIILIQLPIAMQAVKINPFSLSFYTCSITTIVYKLGNQVSNSKAVYVLLALFKVFHRMSTKNKIKHNNYTQYTALHNSPSFYCISLGNLISQTWFRPNNPPQLNNRNCLKIQCWRKDLHFPLHLMCTGKKEKSCPLVAFNC